MTRSEIIEVVDELKMWTLGESATAEWPCIDYVRTLEREINSLEIKRDALRYLLDRAADMLHECGLRDEIYAALKEEK